jgi:molybdopterin converting factor subunit 1
MSVEPIRVTVKLFAILREKAGISEVKLELPAGSTLRGLLELLARRYDALGGLLAKVACAINQEYVSDDPLLADGDEIALIPPVSGG